MLDSIHSIAPSSSDGRPLPHSTNARTNSSVARTGLRHGNRPPPRARPSHARNTLTCKSNDQIRPVAAGPAFGGSGRRRCTATYRPVDRKDFTQLTLTVLVSSSDRPPIRLDPIARLFPPRPGKMPRKRRNSPRSHRNLLKGERRDTGIDRPGSSLRQPVPPPSPTNKGPYQTVIDTRPTGCLLSSPSQERVRPPRPPVRHLENEPRRKI